jgi:hypothetical protein
VIKKLEIPIGTYKMLKEGVLKEYKDEDPYITKDGKRIKVNAYGPIDGYINGRHIQTYALEKPEDETDITVGLLALERVDLKPDKNDPTKLIPNPLHPDSPLIFIGEVIDPRI